MAVIQSTQQWRQGRIGEILQSAVFMRYGLSIIDIGGSTNNRAPLLHRAELSHLAPDSMGFRTAQTWIEHKTKSRHERWRGGSINDAVKVPARTEEGRRARRSRRS
jgi:hypothetical protein